MHYKTIEYNMKLIRKHNDIIYIMKQNGIQDKLFDIVLWEELHLWVDLNLSESAGFEDELYSLWKL